MTEDENTPFWRGIDLVPDERFPIGLHHFPLIEAPDRGTHHCGNYWPRSRLKKTA